MAVLPVPTTKTPGRISSGSSLVFSSTIRSWFQSNWTIRQLFNDTIPLLPTSFCLQLFSKSLSYSTLLLECKRRKYFDCNSLEPFYTRIYSATSGCQRVTDKNIYLQRRGLRSEATMDFFRLLARRTGRLIGLSNRDRWIPPLRGTTNKQIWHAECAYGHKKYAYEMCVLCIEDA